MKKRILSWIMILAMVLGLFPVEAAAAETVTNTAPYIISGETNVSVTVDRGIFYKVIYSEIFADAEGDALSYYWSSDAGANWVGPVTAESYSCKPTETGTINLAFKAFDGELYSPVYNIALIVDAHSEKHFTVPADAEFDLFYQDGYFVVEKLVPVSETLSEDGTMITYAYVDERAGGYCDGYSYRMTDPEGKKITQAGYIVRSGEVDVTLDWKNESPSYRGEYDTSTELGSRGDDSILVNVNKQNHLVLNKGETFRLRAFRIWEIIDSDTTNVMIEPDFHYDYNTDLLSMVSANEALAATTGKVSGNAKDNWMDVTAVGEGVDFMEVSYDALYIASGDASLESGGAFAQTKMFWNAIDPSRKALIVVQTDGKAATDVDFGIISRSSNVSGNFYEASSAVAWDAEFDTVYFEDEKGELSFAPTAESGAIGTVEVSSDKGKTWTTLTADVQGVYTMDVYDGNNIIRVTKDDATTAYQVVRGNKIECVIENITAPGSEIVAGDTIRVTLNGVHYPVGKMSGIYNPGFSNGIRTTYTFNGEEVRQSVAYQYSFIANSWIEVTIPQDAKKGTSYTLEDGYFAFNIMGDAPGAHRGLTDDGREQNTNAGASKYTRSILPDITLNLKPAGNDAPKYNENAPTQVTTKAEVAYTVDLTGVFMDAREDVVTYYMLEGEEWKETTAKYTFSSATAGDYTLKFKAVDDGGLESAVYQLTITVEANEAVWDGTVAAAVKEIDGVYEVSNGKELAWVAEQVNTGENLFVEKTIKLTDDIYLGGKVWPIIGNKGNSSTYQFQGTIDGDGHTIYGLLVNEESRSGNYVGFIGYAKNVEIKNLTIEGSVTGTGNGVGGLIGYTSGSNQITNCVMKINVSAPGSNVGGFIGQDYGKPTIYTGCVNLGNISSGKGNVAGITGMVNSADNSYTDCYNRGNIESSKNYAAGIAITANNKNVYTNCYSTGNVSAVKYAGKLVASKGSVNNCYVINESTLTVNSNASSFGTSVDSDTLKGYASVLGENWTEDTENINGGFPILTFQKVEEKNNAPEFIGQEDTMKVKMKLNEWYELDLSEYYSDADGEALTYYVSYDGKNYTSLESSTFMYYPAGDGEQTATFYAQDEKGAVSYDENGNGYFVLNANVEEAPEEVTVTFSVSTGTDEWFYIQNTETTMVPQEITVPYFDLSLYGLEKYYYNPMCYSTHKEGDTEESNNQLSGTAQTAEGVVTAMHVLIYATEVFYLGYDEDVAGTGLSYQEGTFDRAISWTGGVGSTYMRLWQSGSNLNYYIDYKYPLGAPGWGSTSDQTALYGGENISVHFIEDKNVSGTNFSFFTFNNEDGEYNTGDIIDAATVAYGEEFTLTAHYSQPDWEGYVTTYKQYASENQVYWLSAEELNESVWNGALPIPVSYVEGNPYAEECSETYTDDHGKLNVTTKFMQPGVYYAILAGFVDHNSSTETAPAIFKLTVTGEKRTISFEQEELVFEAVGEAQTLQVNVTPSDNEIAWDFSAEDIVSFDAETGTVTALKPGNTLITATIPYIGLQAVCKVKVPYSVELNVQDACNVVADKTTVYYGENYIFTVEVAEGYETENMEVKANEKVLDAVGGVYTVENVTENLVITVTGVYKPEPTPEVTPEVTPDPQEPVYEVFPDVKETAWYVPGVQFVYDNGLMSGSNGNFNPTSDTTRAQFVTTLYRLAGEPEVTDTSALTDFSDLAEGKYYTDAVCWAYANGITTGTDGKFNPTDKLTRQQMAAFFFRFAEVMGMDTSERGDYSSMVNADKVSGYAEEPMAWAVGAGLISGSDVTVDGAAARDLNPRGNTTRAQVATILMRFCTE